MTRIFTSSKLTFAAILLIFFASTTVVNGADKSIDVANVDALYAAVNDPGNSDGTVQLAPGIYTLSATDSNGMTRPNGGRLELQMGMSLTGVVGDRSAVLIDASALPASSFENPITGVIRVGRGFSGIEWLTVNGHPDATASIETDLLSPNGPSRIRVAHVVSTNSHRGIDVRNIGVDMANRVVEIDIIDTDVSGGLEGFRITNQNNAAGAVIRVRMSDNYSHGNEIGCIVTNARTSTGTISVKSERDTFSDNGLGCLISGALIQGSNVANSNYVSFEARRSKFINNTGPIFQEGGGLVVTAAGSGVAGATSNNTIDVQLSGCRIYGNQVVDFRAFGSRSVSGSLGGTNNRAKVTLRGTSRTLPLEAINSMPEDSAGTNTVTVLRKTTPFDFDGDGKTDIGIVRGANPSIQWWLERSSDGQAYVVPFGSAVSIGTFDRPAPADFDGDGRTDIAVYKDGVWWWMNSGDSTVRVVPFGIASDTPVPADYTGDGRDELAVFRNGEWWSFDLANTQASVVNFGRYGDYPLTGDFDGDGKFDQAVRRADNAWWLNTSTGGQQSIRFGSSVGEWPVVGDYDGDGKTDLAVYGGPGDGKWSLLQSTAGYAEGPFGGDDYDFPIPGDYDGDGRTDLAIYRFGFWYLLQSSDGMSYRRFGGHEWDEPIPAAYLNHPFIP